MNSRRGYYTAKLGGKDRVMRFNMNFWAEFCDTLKIKLEEIGEIFDGGISLSDRENNKAIDYNIYTVGSWLDDMEADQLTGIVNAMMQSKILGNDLNVGLERNPDVEKKTQPAPSKKA